VVKLVKEQGLNTDVYLILYKFNAEERVFISDSGFIHLFLLNTHEMETLCFLTIDQPGGKLQEQQLF
jgi:hypothetical protein